MTRPRSWASLAGATILVAAMSGTGMAQDPSAAPSAAPYPSPNEQPPAPTADITEYPNYGGEVDCEAGTFNGLPYSGSLKKISAPDPMTVLFSFCRPDVAFLSQVAFTALQIDDAQFIIDQFPSGGHVTDENGTGPFQVDEWDIGNRVVLSAFPDYWGEPAQVANLEFRWSDQSAQRLTELLGGSVDGIDNPGKDDLPALEGNPEFTIYPRTALTTFYLGMNNRYEPFDDVNVRQAIARGIDAQRIVDNFFAPGSSVADYFMPCDIPHGCAGDPLPTFDLEAARQLLADAGLADGFQTKIQLRDSDRCYVNAQPTIAQEIQAQLKANLNIDAEIEIQESGTFLDNNAAGLLDGIFMLGWCADYPDATNFMDYHVGSGTGEKFGGPYPDLVEVLDEAAQTPDESVRETLYAEANNLFNEHMPFVPIAHGGSSAVFKADVTGAHSSPLNVELFAGMKPGDRDTLVWMQNKEPLSLFCGDETDGETIRLCAQAKESLYGFEVGGLAAVPKLATECTSNETLDEWTCSLREGVTFHDGSTFDAADVILSYAAQWDAASPLHVGRSSAFEYWPALVVGSNGRTVAPNQAGYLNPPPPPEPES